MNKNYDSSANIELKDGIFDLNIEHAKKIQEASLTLLKKRGTYLDKKAEDNKDKYEAYEKPIVGFKFIRLALKEGYIVIGSDFHGDIASLYKFFVQTGYLIPIKNRFLVACTRYKNTEDKKRKIEYISLDDLDEKKLKSLATQINIIAILPGFEENKYFAGKIKLLGDYIDRGPESLECMLLLDYLTKKEKELLKNDYDKKKLLSVCAGNHELVILGLRKENPKIKKLIGDMMQDKRMIFGSLEIINNIPVYFSHTSMSKFHIYKILGIIRTFYKISECDSIKCTELTEIRQINSYGIVEKVAEKFESKEIEVINHTVLRKIKENFLTLKKHEAYFQLFDKIEKNLTSNYVDKNPEVKQAFDELLKEKKINKEKLKVESYYRRILLYFLERMAQSDAEYTYKLLSKNIFQDEEYFVLREFIVSVLPPDLYSSLYSYSELEVKHLLVFYEKYEYMGGHGYESYIQGFKNSMGERACYWPVEERYIATKEMCFSVIQVVGHDASGLAKIEPNEEYMYFLDRLNPYIKNLDSRSGFDFDNKIGSIICVDTLRSVGYQNKNCPYIYRSKNSNIENKSDSVLFIITPDLNFIVEKYSVLRDNNFEILPDTVKKEETFISLGQDCLTKIDKKDSSSYKKFSSFKRFVSAFSNIKVENKLKNKEIEMIVDDVSENKPVKGNSHESLCNIKFVGTSNDIGETKEIKNKQKEKENIIRIEKDKLDKNKNKFPSVSTAVHEEKEDGEIDEPKETEKIMSPEETLTYFKEKIGNEIRDKNNQLTSEEIDEILKDFNGKTNYESLYFFLRNCGKYFLSCKNLCKLMKYYDDKTKYDLLFSISITLEKNESILSTDITDKLFLNISEKNLHTGVLNTIFKHIDSGINIQKYINNILNNLSENEPFVDLSYFFKRLKRDKSSFKFDQKSIELLNVLNLSSRILVKKEIEFSVLDAVLFCELCGDGMLEKKLGITMIASLYNSFNNSLSFGESKSLKFYAISRADRWFNKIIGAFRVGEAKDYVTNNLITYVEYVNGKIDKLYGHKANRDCKYDKAERNESEKKSFRDRSRNKSIDRNKSYHSRPKEERDKDKSGGPRPY